MAGASPATAIPRNVRRQPARASRFFTIWRLSSSMRGANSSSLALRRKASSPPRWSTVLSALADTRNLILRPSVSEISVTLRRFGRNRRLVLIFEWLTLWPTSGLLPVSSQRHDMPQSSKNIARKRAGPVNRLGKDRGRIESRLEGVKTRKRQKPEVFQAASERTKIRPIPDRRDVLAPVNSVINV